MRHTKALPLVLILFICLSQAPTSAAQDGPSSLRLGEPIERTITRGETHSFTVSLKEDQYLQVVVDQRGIDVVVRVFSPGGKSLGEFDSPNGERGPEGVSIVSQAPGFYRIDVAPLGQEGTPTSGRYEIRILDLRPASKDELDRARNRDAARRKGLALLLEAADTLQQIRLPENRVRAQLQAAQLLWHSDEKRARRLFNEAIGEINQSLANLDPDDQNYSQSYQTAIQLRNDVIMALAPVDADLALSVLRSTRPLVDPDAEQSVDQYSQESQLEVTLASQIAVKNPKRAFEIAEESLKKGYSHDLVNTLYQLHSTDPDSAAKLAGNLAAKLLDENILKNQVAANLAINLLRSAAIAGRDNPTSPTAGAHEKPLLAERQYKELFDKVLSAALAYTPPPSNYYTVERGSAQSILDSLKSMPAEMEKYAPGKAAAVEKSLAGLNLPPDPQSRLLSQFQQTINSLSMSEALEAAAKVPQELRDQVYQQLATKAASAGDVAMAKQIIAEHVSNPIQRQQAMSNIEQQAVYSAINSGKIEDALRGINNIRSPKQRAIMLLQVVNQMGGNQKRATLANILEQASGLVVGSGRAEDQEQMNMLFEMASAYLRLDPKRGFEIIEPLVDQFNEMSAAAMILNGFGQQFFHSGELIMQNGSSLAAVANQLMNTLGSFAVWDFDRAKALADRLQRPEVRLAVYLGIAQQTMAEEANEGR